MVSHSIFKRIIYFIPLIIILFYGCSGDHLGDSGSQISSLQSLSDVQQPVSSTTDYIQNFKKQSSDYVVVDYALQHMYSNSLVKAAISYYNQNKNTNSNVAIITDSGIALIDLAGGNGNFSFAEGGKLTFTAKDTVTIALTNQQTNQIYDFEIKYEYIPEQKMTNVVTSSKIRQ